MSEPWVKPGQKVVEYTDRRMGMPPLMIAATIEKVGKRDVVLDNGNRYNIGKLSKRNGDWDPATYLMSADDPKVTAGKRERSKYNRLNAARSAYEVFQKHPTKDHANELIDAIEADREFLA